MSDQTNVNPVSIKEQVRSRYGHKAQEVLGRAAPTAGCCGGAPTDLTEAAVIQLQPTAGACCGPNNGQAASQDYASRLYDQQALAGLPETVTDASLGCGNPTAIANLKPGQTVLDLGSGGGIDCFLAARQVGPTGRVIGLDMTAEMIELARRNKARLGETAANVSFHLGEMEAMPLPDESVDVIISNCVINLSPDKDAVFREAYRVLRPGGYLAVSDIVARQPMPPEMIADLAAWSGCVAGALDVATYAAGLRRAGFADVDLSGVTPTDFGIGEGAQGGAAAEAAQLVPGGLESWIASAQITAYKR